MKIRIKLTIGLLCMISALPLHAQNDPDISALKAGQTDPTLVSAREDGRQISTYAAVHDVLAATQPECAYHEGMSSREFRRWRKSLRKAMSSIMGVPSPVTTDYTRRTSRRHQRALPACFRFSAEQPSPVMVSSEPREGYTLQKWEFFPLPGVVSEFLVMVPDGADASDRRPAFLCIPGSGVPKEIIAGEPCRYDDPDLRREFRPKSMMALDLVREGYIAVCVDNAATGAAADHEEAWENDDVTPSRLLLELGWNWLGYTSYLDMQVLQWMKTRPEIRRDRIVISGFSLGTEPMMVIGTLDPDVYAFVYNDFLCHTQERALVMTALKADGRRPFPNSIRHLIPEYWRYFNFPDVVASLAPRPVILTEGGLDRDFELLRDAYRTAGAPEAVSCNHYAKYADPSDRAGLDPLPGGVDAQTFFHLANVDTRNHYFKYELVLPWLKEIL